MSGAIDVLNYDILFIGAGPASLSCATKLLQLVDEHNRKVSQTKNGKKIDLENRICIIEKGSTVGAHNLSGALIEEAELRQVVDGPMDEKPFVEGRISNEMVCFLTPKNHFRFPFIPPIMSNKGNLVVSISQLCKYLCNNLEDNGIPVFCGETADELIFENEKVSGVLSYKKDSKAEPQKKISTRIESKVTVLGEGSNGFLTEKLINKTNSNSEIPKTFELGIKELYVRNQPKSDKNKASCVHTLGYPLLQSGDSGGGFIYSTEKYVTIGLVAHLNTENPDFNLHQHMQNFKKHPVVKKQLLGTELIEYGSKTLPCGGFSANSQFVSDGAIIIGDSAGLVDTMRLKGLGNAIGSGIIAANMLFEALVNDNYSIGTLKKYEDELINSPLFKRYLKSDGFSKVISSPIPIPAVPLFGLHAVFGSKLIHKMIKSIPDYQRTKKQKRVVQLNEGDAHMSRAAKEKSVYYAHSNHTGVSWNHISFIDSNSCAECLAHFGAPCTNFCPAGVYAVENEKINVSSENCIHCRTCTVKCPHVNINWEIPCGGSGPKYCQM